MFKSTIKLLENLFGLAESRVKVSIGKSYLSTCGMPKDEEDSFARAWIDIMDAPKDIQK